MRKRALIILASAALVWLEIVHLANAAPLTAPYVVVANYTGGQLLRYDATTGAPITPIGNLPFRPFSWINEINIGPDGNFYATEYLLEEADSQIHRVDAVTGATTNFIDADGVGILRGIDFGPNGNLFAACVSRNSIVEFDGHTGQFIRDFIAGISLPIDIDFSPDGTLYVARGHFQASNPSSILCFDGLTGAPLGTFASTTIDAPQNILVGPDGDVYVTDLGLNRIVQFDGVTGAVEFAVGGISNPRGLAFGPNGELLVASYKDSAIKRFDANTGELLGNFTSGGSLNLPIGVIYVAEPSSLSLSGALAACLLMWRRRRNIRGRSEEFARP